MIDFFFEVVSRVLSGCFMFADVVRRWTSSKCVVKLGFVLRQERILGYMSYFPIETIFTT